jgi:hypothetical protein
VIEDLLTEIVRKFNSGFNAQDGEEHPLCKVFCQAESNIKKLKDIMGVSGGYPKKTAINELIESNEALQQAVLKEFEFPPNIVWPKLPEVVLYSLLSDNIHKFSLKGVVLISNKADQNFRAFIDHISNRYGKKMREFDELLTIRGKELVYERLDSEHE